MRKGNSSYLLRETEGGLILEHHTFAYLVSYYIKNTAFLLVSQKLLQYYIDFDKGTVSDDDAAPLR
jgi:hypothetical protein